MDERYAYAIIKDTIGEYLSVSKYINRNDENILSKAELSDDVGESGHI